MKQIKKTGVLTFNDSDIAKIEAAHDLLLDNGFELKSYTLSNLRELTCRMYDELNMKH